MKLHFFLYLLFSSWPLYLMPQNLHVHVQAKATTQQSIPIVLGAIEANTDLETISTLVSKNISCTKQCKATVKPLEKPSKKHNIQKLAAQYDLAIFFDFNTKKEAFEWRMYDTASGSMMASKRLRKANYSLYYCAQKISSDIWKALMNEKLDFTAPIAYCQKSEDHRKQVQNIYITDFSGSKHTCVVARNKLCIAPRWNHTSKHPLLFFSEYTKQNIQLMLTNLFGDYKTLSSFDGINMQPAYSPNGKQLVYCLSKDGSSQLYHCKNAQKQKICHRITHNTSNNLAPCFIDNDRIAFASDHESTSPKIYIMNLKTKNVTRLTDTGYCACPSYNKQKNMLCYGKILNGVMQIFLYDFKTKKHIQITDSFDNKEEMSWSPCGSCIVFASSSKGTGRIGILHIASKNIHYITNNNHICNYPDWAPAYSYNQGLL